MAKYQCDKGHIFNHPAKAVEHFKAKPYTGTFVILGKSPIATDQKIDVETDWVENSFEVCPFCGQREFKEFVEPEADYEGWEQVTHKDVNSWLAKGYKVLSHTKDNVVMAKCKDAPVFKNPDPDDNQVFMDQVQTAYSKIPEVKTK